MKLVTVPVAKWTRYGRWTPDGMQVLNQNEKVIYSHPAYRPPPPVPVACIADSRVQRD